MYLHLGQNAVVPETEVIGIFDLDNTTGSYITRKFLSEADKTGRVISVSDELPNSFVVCDEGKTPYFKECSNESNNTIKIYLSQLSSQTLVRRVETMRFE